MRIPVGGGFAGRIAAGRRPIYIADVDHAEILNPILRMKGVRSLLGVPLIVEGALLGVLHVGTRHAARVHGRRTPRCCSSPRPRPRPRSTARGCSRRSSASIATRSRCSAACCPTACPTSSASTPPRATCRRATRSAGTGTTSSSCRGGHVGIAIGDVAGHGLRAAALMGQLRAGLRAYALDGHSPGGHAQAPGPHAADDLGPRDGDRRLRGRRSRDGGSALRQRRPPAAVARPRRPRARTCWRSRAPRRWAACPSPPSPRPGCGSTPATRSCSTPTA